MPKSFDENAYNDATPSTGGGEYKKMPAGGYVVQIQAVRTEGESYGKIINYPEEKMYVKLIYDIAEGEFAGKYSDEYWAGPDKDYGHVIYLSWKNMNAFKGSVQAIEESNPGFEFMPAFKADQWGLFVGLKVGIVIGEEEYLANDGNVKTRYTMARMKSVQDIRDGKFRVPKLKTLDSSTSPSGSGQDEQAPIDTYDDVPFM